MEDARYRKGVETLEAIAGPGAAAIIESMNDIAPDLVDWIFRFSYGDVMSRPGLDLRSRQFATLGALTAMGTAPTQLRFHINGALNVGCTPAEIIEVMLQMAVYTGFPAAINAIGAAREVFRERGVAPAAKRP